MTSGSPRSLLERRQRLRAEASLALQVLCAALVGVLVPADVIPSGPARALLGLATVGIGTLLVRWVIAVLARSLGWVRLRLPGAPAPTPSHGRSAATAWMVSTAVATLPALALFAFHALSAFDAMDDRSTLALSLAIAVALTAAGLVAAFAVAWLIQQAAGRIAVVLGALVLALAAGALHHREMGRLRERVGFPSSQTSVAMGDPALAGPYQVEVLGYGPGDDSRPEFGAAAQLRTVRLDLAAVAPLPGWTAARTARLGAGPDAVPVAGLAYLPRGSGPFPLVLIAHGTTAMEVRSEQGFEQLGRLLASRGYAVAAIDMGFLGYGRYQAGDLGGRDVLARARLLLAHAEAWAGFAGEPGGAVQGRIDLDRVALVGHSRGGEAAIVAARIHAEAAGDRRLQVRAVAALAPTANLVSPSLATAFLTLHGDLDNDVEAFLGLRTFEDVRLSGPATGSTPPFKVAVYVEGANHAKFNERWGASDHAWPLGVLESRRGALAAVSQRRVLSVCLSAFLDATLRGDPHGRDLLRDARRLRPLLPGVTFASRFRDGGGRLLVDFDVDRDLGSDTFPGVRLQLAGARARQVTLPLRLPGAFGALERQVLELAWTGLTPAAPARLAIDLGAAGFSLADQDLTFDLALESPVPVRIMLQDRQGRWAVVRLEEVFPVRPFRQESLTLFEAAELDSHELPFQTVILAARDLRQGAEPGFDREDIRRVEFEFGGATGRVLLDDPATQPN